MTEWQPIETAPRQGRYLVWGGIIRSDAFSDYTNKYIVLVEVDCDDDLEPICFSVADSEYYSPSIENPTHWMPLPKPPPVKGEGND
jgi:hypothetical protein